MAIQESHAFKEQTKKSIQQKGGNLLLFLNLEYKKVGLHVFTWRNATTTSGQFKDYSWKRWFSWVTLSRDQKGFVTWESSSNTVTSGINPFSIPINTLSVDRSKTCTRQFPRMQWMRIQTYAYKKENRISRKRKNICIYDHTIYVS